MRHALGVECLGVLPDATRLREMRGARRGAALNRVVITAPTSRFAHAVRAIRTAVLLSSGERQGRAIGYVSWLHGEGRTTLASNVAHLIAVSGYPVELIDGDLGRPTLTAQLAPRCESGLSEALLGRAAGMSRVQTVELTPSLRFLPAVGAGQEAEPNVYLGAPEMVGFLADLTLARDVVVDLPPLATSSDAQALCPYLDGVVLVVEAGRTRIEDVRDALRVLRAANANVLGVVLNKSSVGRSGKRARP